MKKKLTNQELSDFCEQFSILLHAGISCTEGLHLLQEDSHTKESREIYDAMIRDIEENGSFSETLKNTGVFPDTMIPYVAAGEETGCLDEVMKNLSVRYQQEVEITEHIRQAVTYPFLMMAMMIGVIVILLAKVLPVFRQVFAQMGMEMNSVSSGLLNIGNVISRYSSVLAIIILILLIIILYLSVTEKGHIVLRKMAEHLPYFKAVPFSLDYGRLTQAIAMGIRSGLDYDMCFQLADGLVTHPAIRQKMDKARELLNDGALFSDALTESQLFEGMNARMIKISLRAGSADDTMQTLSDRYQAHSMTIIENAISVVEPTIVIVFSLLVGMILLSVMMPLLGILSDIIV